MNYFVSKMSENSENFPSQVTEFKVTSSDCLYGLTNSPQPKRTSNHISNIRDRAARCLAMPWRSVLLYWKCTSEALCNCGMEGCCRNEVYVKKKNATNHHHWEAGSVWLTQTTDRLSKIIIQQNYFSSNWSWR